MGCLARDRISATAVIRPSPIERQVPGDQLELETVGQDLLRKYSGVPQKQAALAKHDVATHFDLDRPNHKHSRTCRGKFNHIRFVQRSSSLGTIVSSIWGYRHRRFCKR